MSTTLTKPAAAIFDGYTPAGGGYDEMLAAADEMRSHWETFAGVINGVGADELTRRGEQANRMVRENGMVYSAYGEAGDVMRPWYLDVLPLLISAEEWQAISVGLIQRAQFLNRIIADLYGPQKLLSDGLLPADLIFSHPGFTRPFHNTRPDDKCHLHLFAVDLARSADGKWWVMGDRTDAPLGVGYALENRIVTSRILPEVMRQCQVERLASFFIKLRETLRQLAPERRENPRIVLLSHGPTGPNYFEDAYLARYLGYTLVEGADLAVRDNRVFMKTLSGLLPVDVIFRRLSDRYSDPLEVRSENSLGVAGLLQAVRAGHVAVANALGSSLVESPALLPFLPRIAREVFGEELLLPSVATWWCGQDNARKHVFEHVERLDIRCAFRVGRQEPIPMELLMAKSKDELRASIAANPTMFVGQEQVARSTAPNWHNGAAQSCHVALRVFLVASEGSYTVLPGGLVSVSKSLDSLDLSLLAADGSKDAWVLSDKPVQPVTLLAPAGKAVELRRSGTAMASRVADNVFWLGRHIERAEEIARLLRPILVRLTSESELQSTLELQTLLHCLAAHGGIEPGFVIEGIRDQLPDIKNALPAAIIDAETPGSLRSTISAAHRNASMVRDRLSLDSWRIIHGLKQQLDDLSETEHNDLTDSLELVNGVIIDLAALDGLIDESMTRTQAWQFLDLGRRLERALNTVGLVQTGLLSVDDVDASVLEAILEVADSVMTYRSRYLASWQMAPVLDLLITDETNPRSLAFQLVALADHVENLPHDDRQPLLGAEQRIALAAINGIRMLDVESLYEERHGKEPLKLERVLSRLSEQLPRLSHLISHRYLIHAVTPRQLSEGNP